MSEIKCKICKCTVVEDSDEVDKTQKYMMCPSCGRQFPNPLYEGEKNE